MRYSLYAPGGFTVVIFTIIGVWNGVIFAIFVGSALMMIVTCHLGIKLLLDSKVPGDTKMAAVIDFCITGVGILVFSTVIITDAQTFIFEPVVIHLLLSMGAVTLSLKILRKTDNSHHRHAAMINSCKCRHSLDAHTTNGSECSICMCRYFQKNSE